MWLVLAAGWRLVAGWLEMKAWSWLLKGWRWRLEMAVEGMTMAVCLRKSGAVGVGLAFDSCILIEFAFGIS